MRKNTRVFLLGVAMILALLSACSSKSNDDSIEISYGTWANPGEPAYDGMEKFKEIIEKETEGYISEKIFPGNQIGSTEEQLEQVQLGVTEMISSGNPGLDKIEYLSLPYLTKSNSHWLHVLESDIGKEWNDTLINEMGIENIGILPRGPRVISSNKKVNKPEDMAGLKLRSPRSEEHTSELQSRFDLVCRL